MALIMHASEIPEGNYWQKVVAKAAIKAPFQLRLRRAACTGKARKPGSSPCGPIGTGRNSMLRAIDRMTPGDMPDFDPSLQMAMKGLNGDPRCDEQAHRRHQRRRSHPPPARRHQPTRRQQDHGHRRAHRRARQRPRRDRPSCATCAKTKGRFYNVTNPKALPRIYQKEARSISRPLIFEQTNAVAAQAQLPRSPSR